MGFTWDLTGILYDIGIYIEFLWDLNGTANRILWDMQWYFMGIALDLHGIYIGFDVIFI